MQVNIKEFLEECGLEEALYPGKRAVKKLAQPGEYKSHCVVYDWRAPETLRVDIKAGLSGKDLAVKDLKKYPVSFQMPTYIEIGIAANDKAEEEGDEDGEARGGKSGGGGGRKVKMTGNAFQAFSAVVEGKIPEGGEIRKMVVMGKEIAHTAFKTVIEALTAQIKHLAIVPVNLLAAANAVKMTVAMPGGRHVSDLAVSQVEGKATYRPKDMFGTGGPT